MNGMLVTASLKFEAYLFFPFHLFICLFHHVHEGVYSVMVF